MCKVQASCMPVCGCQEQPSNFLFQVLREGKVFTNPDDDANGTGNATDGDLDAAYALFLAAREWEEVAYKKRGIEVC